MQVEEQGTPVGRCRVEMEVTVGGEVCAHCKKSKPTKRCAKRHPKCLEKLFCNETCEMLAHKKKENPSVAIKSELKKGEQKKKKTKKENMKHGQVRASIAYKDYE